MTKNQARGYLYEILISHLLTKNHFLKCQMNNQTNISYNCGIMSQDGEVLGRGTQHQIDFVGIYQKNIPFIYPIRLLAECKFWTKENKYKPVDKSFIREYIGVHKDISENYFSSNMQSTTRFLDVPIIFSAGGFNSEAEKLAWAQGINLVSHSKLPIMVHILKFINFIVNTLPTQYMMNKKKFEEVRNFVLEIIRGHISKPQYPNIINEIRNSLNRFPDSEAQIDGFISLLDNVRKAQYNTFLFATTEYGKVINLISYDEFPDELFINSEEQDCRILFDENSEIMPNENSRVFYITLNSDERNRQFYFQANEAMLREDFSRLSLRERINEKEKYFTNLTIMKEIRGLTRLISLKVNFENVMHRIR